MEKAARLNICLRANIMVVCVAAFTISCKNNNNDIRSILKDNKKQTWIKKKYVDEQPLAQLVNIGNFCDTSCTFEITCLQKIEIYATGELVYQLSDVAPDYFFKSDDLEIFLKKKLQNGTDSLLTLNFSWLDGKAVHGKIATVKQGITFVGALKVDSLNSKYLISLKIPWKLLGIDNVANGTKIEFDSAIGDNDDDYKQKAKLSLFNKTDILNKPHISLGRIVLSDSKLSTSVSKDPNTIQSRKFTLPVDTSLTDQWKAILPIEIKNLAMGFVKDKYDLSAKVKTCWNKDGLFLYYEVQDYNRKQVAPKKIRTLQTFLDYAWIEDAKGKTIWGMHELDSSPADGAVKNRKIDAQIKLLPGTYTLHYTSDESHAFNNWDAAPPSTPFYGVVVYNSK